MLSDKFFYTQLMLSLMDLRDPRCDDPGGKGSYVLGMIHGLNFGSAITDASKLRAFELLSNARKHHYARTPWPEVKPYFPF